MILTLDQIKDRLVENRLARRYTHDDGAELFIGDWVSIGDRGNGSFILYLRTHGLKKPQQKEGMAHLKTLFSEAENVEFNTMGQALAY